VTLEEVRTIGLEEESDEDAQAIKIAPRVAVAATGDVDPVKDTAAA